MRISKNGTLYSSLSLVGRFYPLERRLAVQVLAVEDMRKTRRE